jgi:AbrB family looped-hinge helix DNA binding protein
MLEATITSKGRVTIPADIRKSMRLKEGERVVFTVLDDGTTVIRAKSRSLVVHKGMLKNIGAAERSPRLTFDDRAARLCSVRSLAK